MCSLAFTCFTRVLPASLFDKLASNRIAAQLSANLMAPGQPQDLADHHVKPSHSTLKFSSSSSAFLPIFLPLLSSCTALRLVNNPHLHQRSSSPLQARFQPIFCTTRVCLSQPPDPTTYLFPLPLTTEETSHGPPFLILSSPLFHSAL